MMRLLRFTSTLIAVCLFALPAAGQQTIPLLENHPLARLSTSAAGQAQATFVPKRYRLENLESTNPLTYQPIIQTTYRYESGRIAEEINESMDLFGGSGQFHNTSRRTYEHALNRETYWRWENSAWKPGWRDTYTYDSQGRITMHLNEDYEGGRWVNSTRVTNTYTSSQVTILYESWQSGAWSPYSRDIHTEESGSTIITEQEWNGSAWVNESRTTVPGVSLSQSILASAEMEDILIFGFFFVPTRSQAEWLMGVELVNQDWNGSAWVNDSRRRVTSKTATEIVSVLEDWNGSAWVADGRTTLTFSGTRATSMFSEEFEGGKWTPDSKVTYTYDSNGNVTLIENFSDDDDGGFETVAGGRAVIEWTSITTAVEGDEAVRVASLTSVQPSPATDAAEVHFALAQPGPVMLRLFDVLGREVSTLAAGVHAAGAHAAQLDAASLPAGLYFVRLEAGGVSETRSLVVAR